jgi:hypothetical protein
MDQKHAKNDFHNFYKPVKSIEFLWALNLPAIFACEENFRLLNLFLDLKITVQIAIAYAVYTRGCYSLPTPECMQSN